MIWCEVMNHEEYLNESGEMIFRSLFACVENKMTGEYWSAIIV